MGPFSKLKIFIWLHSHEYEKILSITVCDLFDTKESIEKIRAHALAAIHLESYFDARKHYELLVKRHKRLRWIIFDWHIFMLATIKKKMR